MRKNILIMFILVLSSNIAFGISAKFDVAGHFSLGGFKGLQNNPAIGPGRTGAESRDMSLNIFSIGGGLSLDLILIKEDNAKYYGMGPSLYINVSSYNQGFSSDIFMVNTNQIDFGPDENGNTNKPYQQMVPAVVVQIAPLYRFYPIRDISIGIGPVINIITYSTDYTKSEYYTGANEDTGLPNGNVPASNYYIKPMLGENIYISAMVDVQVTKFFGNIGITGGLALHSIFLPFAVGLEGNFSVRYRFNP